MSLPPLDFPISLILGLCLTLGVCLAICVGRILTQDPREAFNVEWLLQLSTERYRPMLRLLSDDDVAFLQSQPGYRPAMAARLRRQRCQILGAYLQSLDSDFHRMCGAMKALMVQSHQDRPDLARALFRSQIHFAAGIGVIRVRIALYRLGLGKVDVANLVNLFDVTRLQLKSLVPATGSANL